MSTMNAPAKKLVIELSTDEQAHVRECLDLIEEAQGLINRAASALCPVRGFADVWGEASDVYETVKHYWHRVNARRGGLSRGLAICPSCEALLPADGSCCDECDWTAPV